jgi:hypothetical protein
MGNKSVNGIFPDQNREEVKAAIATIAANMSFLISMSKEERKKRLKMGDKSLAFVSHSLNVTQNNPEVVPPNFSTEEFANSYQLVIALTEVLGLLEQLTEKVDDTLLAAGGDAMSDSLLIYDYVKAAAKHSPGLKSVADQLGERFKVVSNRRPKVNQETE